MDGRTDPDSYSALSDALAVLTVADLRERCAQLPAPRAVRLGHVIDEPRLASTIVPVVPGEHGLEVVVTRRSATMTYHRNDWVFPGGRVDVDAGETAAEAARRELCEELGVAPASVELLGELDTFGPIITGFEIRSFVGLISPDAEITPDPGEVAEVLRVSLADLARPDRHRSGDSVPDHDTGPLATSGSLPPRAGDRGYRLRFFSVAPGQDLWGTQADILWCLMGHLAGSV